MDSRVAKEWTTSEIEEARSFIASLNDSCNNNDDGDEMSTKHNGAVENLLKLFPWKTIQEVTGLYVELIVERRTMQSQEKSGGASGMHDVDPKSALVSDNFGISEGEEAMLDAEDLLFDYPLEEMEIGTETHKAPVVEENEVEAGMETHEAPAVEENEVEAEMETREVQVVVEKEVEVEVAENRADHRPMAPQKGMPWTTEEQSLFLQGLRVFGRGKWKSISKHFVTTRTPVQISSHAQKYFQKMEKNAAAAAKRQRCSVVDEASNPSMKNAAAAERQRCSVVDEAGNPSMKNAAAEERQSCSVVDEAGNRRDLCMRNVEFAARAFAFAGVNYDPCLEALDLPPSPSFLEDLAKIWAPLLYYPQASQAWGEQVMVSAPAAPMEGAGSSVAAGHGASLPQPPLLHRPRASQAWGEQLMVSAPAPAPAAAAAPMEGAGGFVAAGHGASLPQPPLLYCPQASQAWGEQVMVSPAATAPTEGAGNSVAAGHGASLPQQWTGSMY